VAKIIKQFQFNKEQTQLITAASKVEKLNKLLMDGVTNRFSIANDRMSKRIIHSQNFSDSK